MKAVFMDLGYIDLPAVTIAAISGIEELPVLERSLIEMHNSTKRTEALASGTIKLVVTDYDKTDILEMKLIDDKNYYDKMSKAINQYGDGNTCLKIVKKLRK